MTDAPAAYDEIYAILVHLCEEQMLLTGEAVMLVMEAFNSLSELWAPDRLLLPDERSAVEALTRALGLLDRVIARSKVLADTLCLSNVRDLLDDALAAQS